MELPYLRFHPAFCSSFRKGEGEHCFLVFWDLVEVEVRVQLCEPVVQTIAVSMVVLRFVDPDTIGVTVSRGSTLLIATIPVFYLDFLSFRF